MKNDTSIMSTIPQLQTMVQMLREHVCLLRQQVFSQHQQLLIANEQVKSLQLQLSQPSSELLYRRDYGDLFLFELVQEFIKTFHSHSTQRTYTEGFEQLFSQGFLDKRWTLSEFRNLNGEKLLDDVRNSYQCRKSKGKEIVEASQNTKQLRCAMLLSFSTYLQRRTQGYIQKIVSNKFGGNKTFRHRRQKTTASKLTHGQIDSFLKNLKSFSLSTYLIAVLQILGARRITEVLQLMVKDFDYVNNRVYFRVLKGKGVITEPIAIYLPQQITEELNTFLVGRKDGFFFAQLQKDNCSPPTKAQIAKLYEKGWRTMENLNCKHNDGRACFKPRMITHALRAFAITTLYEKSIDSQLIKEITGHASADMTAYYKLTEYENITKKIHIFEPSS